MPLPPSAADVTRFKRLRTVILDINARGNGIDMQNVITPPTCAPPGCQSRAGIRRDQDPVVGQGRTRREASKWIDFVAAQQTDITYVRQDPTGRKVIRQQLCNVQICPPESLVPTKVGVLRSAVYQHSRIV